MKPRPVLIVCLVLMLLAGLASCGTEKKTPPNPGGKLTVVATLFPLYDFARKIAADKADVILLLPPGTEPHAFEPKPGDMVRINKAQVFIYAGKYMEPWAEDVIKGSLRKELVVTDATKGIKLVSAGKAEKGHRSRGHGSYDPHVWLDFENAVVMVRTIADGLSKSDPANAGTYDANARSYIDKLRALDAEYRGALSSCEKKTIVHGGHFAFGYLARRYGLEYLSAYEGSPNAEPSAQRIVGLKKAIDEKGVHYVFFEELIDPRVARILSRETGAELLRLHGAHNVMKDELERGVTFISLMEDNLLSLKKGLECK